MAFDEYPQVPEEQCHGDRPHSSAEIFRILIKFLQCNGMNKWEVINLWIISGNKDQITKREQITGIVEIIHPPVFCSDWAWILRPVEFLRAEQVCGTVDPARIDSDDPMSFRNEQAKVMERQERLVTGNAGLRMRHITGLNRKDAFKAFNAKPGDVLTFTRSGWGETFTYSLRKL